MVINKLTSKYRKAKKWAIAQKQKNIPSYKLVIYHLPLKIIKSLAITWRFSQLCTLINVTLLHAICNMPRFRRFYNHNTLRPKKHFYIVVVPNSLHFLIPCLKCLPESIYITLILNGTKRWEEAYLKKKKHQLSVF